LEENIARTIRGIKTWDEIKTFEANAKARDRLTPEIRQALTAQSIQLGRQLVAERTNVDVSILTPAEEKIIEAVSEYTSLLKSQGKYPGRTFEQIKNRGLIGAAEESVTKSKPTQGFTTLEVADLESLSYEQIIVDHEIEFTQRALWFAKRTLGLPVDTDIAPVAEKSAVQTRTIAFINWIRSLTSADAGTIPSYSNAAAAKAMGIVDTQKYGRVLGNIQSRIDYACLLTELPPIGLAADHAFDKAWGQEGRNWAFPVTDMRSAALSRVWTDTDFTRILEQTGDLPGQAHLLWKSALATRESWVKDWAFGLLERNSAPTAPSATIPDDADNGAGNTKQEMASKLLAPQSIYTRNDLMRILSTQDSTINTGVFRPAGFSSVLLFVTKDKTQDRTQYADHLDGEILHWQGQSKGRTDPLIIDHQQRGLELLVFYREQKYEHDGAGFRYEGCFKYISHSGKEPTDFILQRMATDLGLARAEAEAAGDFDPSNVEDARKKMMAAIVRRQGQPAFRRELLRAYNGRCVVTGCQVAEVLEAAHIMPYRGPHTNHISNGLLLRADLHTLFDLGLIAIDQKSTSLIVTPALLTTDYGQWHGKTLTLPTIPTDHPSAEALRLHRETTDL
jgi:putative restriction endonuclease